MVEDAWGVRQQGVATTPSAMLEAASTLPDDVDHDMSKGEHHAVDTASAQLQLRRQLPLNMHCVATTCTLFLAAGDADMVADATQGRGLHQGLGFASAPADSPATVAAPAAAGVHALSAASPPHNAHAAGHPGSGAACVATVSLADSNDSSSDDDNCSALLGSSGDGGHSPPILYDVAYSPGLGSGGFGGASAPGLGFAIPTAALSSAGGPGTAATSDAAPAQQPVAQQGGWPDVPQLANASTERLAAAAAAMAADAAREPAASMSALAPEAPAASLRWFDGPGGDQATARSPADSQWQQHDSGAPHRDGQTNAQRLRDLARAAAERRAIGGGATPMEAGGGGGRRPAIGLMTPNETAAQVDCLQSAIQTTCTR